MHSFCARSVRANGLFNPRVKSAFFKQSTERKMKELRKKKLYVVVDVLCVLVGKF